MEIIRKHNGRIEYEYLSEYVVLLSNNSIDSERCSVFVSLTLLHTHTHTKVKVDYEKVHNY